MKVPKVSRVLRVSEVHRVPKVTSDELLIPMHT